MELRKNTKELKSETHLFIFFFIISILFARILVYTLFTERTALLRSVSGLSVHHFHYGILLLILSTVFMIFFKETKLIVSLAGIGCGLTVDSFIPSLLLQTERAQEIIAYNKGIFPTIVLTIVILSVILFRKFLFKHKNKV
ncbi:MAG: hypothetical protein ACP5NS_04325 [Candidatus Pacearchaeota archaeon]